MNILFVHEIDYLKSIIFEMQQLPELLSLRGHDVSFMDYENKWDKGGWFSPNSWIRGNRVYPEAHVNIDHAPFVKIPVISRISTFFFQYKMLDKMVREKHIDVIVSYAVPTSGLQVLAIGHKYHIPVIFRSLDVLHDLVKNKFLSKITYHMEKYVYRRVDQILTINPDLSRYVIEMGASKEKVKLLPMGVDTVTFKPSIDTSELVTKYKLQGKKVILFVGTLYTFSGLDNLIDKMGFILKQVPEAVLLIVGDGEQRKLLDSMVEELGLQDNVIITGYQKHDLVPQFINLSSVCLLPFVDCGATNRIMPIKVLQYLSCGKLVIATPLFGVREVIGEDNGVIYSDNIPQTIVDLLQDDEKQCKAGNAGFNYIMGNNSFDHVVSEFERIVDECCSN